LEFQQYQYAFTAHIRDPKKNPKPDNVDEERMSIYRDGVYNNVFESASVCFPVCQKTLGKSAWDSIMRRFFATHHAGSPIFREIPQELLAFLQTDEDVPDYIKQLAHYEWVELAVGMQKVSAPKLSEETDLLNEVPVLTPAHMLLQYDYPVQKISPEFIPENKEDTYLLVFRNQEFDVNFIELNPMMYALLELIQQGLTGKQALTSLAEQIQHPQPEVIIEFGAGVLNDLMQQGAILAS
ncbi:MAG TPA: putative DNA-binding domain-containing protein, partial [Methylophilaceae bacterium]|nr:putative DNA-binding domain-containing protein [Methylophilaceae bacterium]